eukprot:307764_1
MTSISFQGLFAKALRAATKLTGKEIGVAKKDVAGFDCPMTSGDYGMKAFTLSSNWKIDKDLILKVYLKLCTAGFIKPKVAQTEAQVQKAPPKPTYQFDDSTYVDADAGKTWGGTRGDKMFADIKSTWLDSGGYKNPPNDGHMWLSTIFDGKKVGHLVIKADGDSSMNNRVFFIVKGYKMIILQVGGHAFKPPTAHMEYDDEYDFEDYYDDAYAIDYESQNSLKDQYINHYMDSVNAYSHHPMLSYDYQKNDLDSNLILLPSMLLVFIGLCMICFMSLVCGGLCGYFMGVKENKVTSQEQYDEVI